MSAVESAPVFQRKSVEAGYKGFKVSWELEFRSINQYEKDKVKLSTVDSRGYPWVYFNVNLDKYPELKILKIKEKIIVKGKIDDISGHTINLVHCHIDFLKQNKSVPISMNPKIKNLTIKNNMKEWFKNLETDKKILIITAVVTLLVAIISIPWWPRIFSFLKNNINNNEAHLNTKDNSNQNIDIFSSSLRALEPLETGKKIEELPNNVYFFGIPGAIAYAIKNPKNNFLQAENKRLENFSFEIQKIDNRYYLVGFIGDEAYSNIGSLNSGKNIYTILFPNQWQEIKHPVAVPFDVINTIDYRTINIDENTDIRVFDIEFSNIKENPEVHIK